MTASEHHVEVFIEDGAQIYGWQCFTCGQEIAGFVDFRSAAIAAVQHDLTGRGVAGAGGGTP